jgi:hypothetical protein
VSEAGEPFVSNLKQSQQFAHPAKQAPMGLSGPKKTAKRG